MIKPTLSIADGYFDDWAARHREERILSKVMQQFLQQLGFALGGLPDTYMAVDVETTGCAPADLVVQLGYCLVEEGKSVEKAAITLDWTQLVEEQWLRERLEATKQHVEYDRSGFASGRRYHFTIDSLRQGAAPVECLQSFYDLLMDCRSGNVPLVMHGGYNLDQRMLKNHFKEFLKVDWEFGDNEVWDTGAIECASQLEVLPNQGESLKSFAKRCAAGRRGVFWSLDQYCVPKYRLADKYSLKTDDAHDAGYDAWVTHLLFEEFKAIARKQIPDPEEAPWA